MKTRWLGGIYVVGVWLALVTAAEAQSVLEGVFTDGQASSGERTFRRECSSCHDPAEFSGGRFRLSWVGRTTGDLFDTMSILMPEANPGSLTPDQYASLVAYLFRLNGYPSGEVPLPADSGALHAIPIVQVLASP